MNNSISWDDYFMGISQLSCLRSKDPKMKVGACIVDSDRKIVGVGYNGFPNGCDDSDFPWTSRTDSKSILESKHAYVCHAESNAILNSSKTKDCTLYVTLFPCNECTKLIIQSGIRKVVYLKMHRPDDEIYIASKRMMKSAGIKVLKLYPEVNIRMEKI